MESPYKEILIFIFGGGAITTLIALAKEIRERVADKKREKSAAAAADISRAADIRRIDNEADEASFARLKQMLEISQGEERRLREEIANIGNASSLSHITVRHMYDAYNSLGRRISRMKGLIEQKAHFEKLIQGFDDLEKKYEELGDRMPGTRI